MVMASLVGIISISSATVPIFFFNFNLLGAWSHFRKSLVEFTSRCCQSPSRREIFGYTDRHGIGSLVLLFAASWHKKHKYGIIGKGAKIISLTRPCR
ncbi:hypothetical protein GQ600_5448 [Phytophthora cactorum]|nr:hypothetical protein GQ600_5448 [Phytophthora cactorum]